MMATTRVLTRLPLELRTKDCTPRFVCLDFERHNAFPPLPGGSESERRFGARIGGLQLLQCAVIASAVNRRATSVE